MIEAGSNIILCLAVVCQGTASELFTSGPLCGLGTAQCPLVYEKPNLRHCHMLDSRDEIVVDIGQSCEMEERPVGFPVQF